MNFISSGVRRCASPLSNPDFSAVDFKILRQPVFGMRSGDISRHPETKKRYGYDGKTYDIEKYVEIRGKHEIVREDTGESMGVVGEKYFTTDYATYSENIVEAFTESKNDVNTDDATCDFQVYEGGRKMKAIVKLPGHKIEPVVGDISQCQFKAFDSLDATWARTIDYYAFRWWCSNGCDTVDFKLRFYQKHTKQMSSDESIAKLQKRIISSITSFHKNEALFKSWVNTKIEFDDAMGIFKDTLAAYRDAQGKIRHSEKLLDNMRFILSDNFNHLGHNGWAAYNAATEWATHLEDGIRGKSHNVKRNRSAEVAKMLASPAWNTHFLTGD